MASVNKVILVGNLGADPEVRYTQGGQPVANLRIATNEVWNDREGNRQERTEWHSVTVWGRQAESCGQYLSKGRQVYIEGRLQSREYTDREGQNRKVWDVVANQVTFLGGGERGQRQGGGGGNWGGGNRQSGGGGNQGGGSWGGNQGGGGWGGNKGGGQSAQGGGGGWGNQGGGNQGGGQPAQGGGGGWGNQGGGQSAQGGGGGWGNQGGGQPAQGGWNSGGNSPTGSNPAAKPAGAAGAASAKPSGGDDFEDDPIPF